MTLTTLERLALVRDLASSGEARRLREAAKLSLREIAEACGVHVMTVQRWETGARRPRGEAALRYAAVLTTIRPKAAA